MVVGYLLGDGDTEALAVGLGVALHRVLDPSPKVDATGGTLPVMTTRYR
jgi:hypothetical protein